jgi:hypothetical protein
MQKTFTVFYILVGIGILVEVARQFGIADRDGKARSRGEGCRESSRNIQPIAADRRPRLGKLPCEARAAYNSPMSVSQHRQSTRPAIRALPTIVRPSVVVAGVLVAWAAGYFVGKLIRQSDEQSYATSTRGRASH